MSDNLDTRLILIRHGESVVTVNGVLGGANTCSGLSDLGRHQAEALRDRWKNSSELSVDALYSSPLPRALETADIVNEALLMDPIHVDEDLEEFRPGDADGMRFDELTEKYGPIDFRSRPDRPLAENTETAMGFHHRTSRALERVVAENLGKTVVIACHGGVVDVAFRHFLDLPRRGMFDLWTLNASLTEFAVNDHDHERARWRLVRYNDHAHLAGLPPETPRNDT
ncbi:MAG: histidine phosphatase family protein [Acidimicrobiales bacterium]